jgi:hypothetical protein
MKLVLAAAVLVAVMAGAEAGSVTIDQYRGCDGYGMPSRDGDGMTDMPPVFFLFSPPSSSNTSRAKSEGGVVGVADCDAALTDLAPRYWMRKVSLLRARAIHQVTIGDYAKANADLDAAEAAAAGHDDPFYARSLGWGLAMTRAYALRSQGDKAKASEIVMRLVAERPYNRQTLYTAMLALGPAGGEAEFHTIQTDLAKLLPEAVDELFIRAIDTGHFAEVLALYPQLKPPPADRNYRARDSSWYVWAQLVIDEKFWASRSGAYAYALLATGDTAGALAAVEAARQRLAANTAPPPPLTDAQKAADPTAEATRTGLADAHARAAREGGKYLGEWARLIDLRRKIADGKVDEVIAAIRAAPVPKSGASVEFLDALQARLPAAKRPPTPLSQRLKNDLAQSHDELPTTTPESFLNDLPQPEIAERLPDYGRGARTWLGAPDDLAEGYRIGEPDPKGVVKIRFNGDKTTSGTMVEEAALLRAADEARRLGRKGFIIIDRLDLEVTIKHTAYGTTLRTEPGGFQTELDVLFVDPANLPAEYPAWRVLDPDAIYARLAPIYVKAKRR